MPCGVEWERRPDWPTPQALRGQHTNPLREKRGKVLQQNTVSMLTGHIVRDDDIEMMTFIARDGGAKGEKIRTKIEKLRETKAWAWKRVCRAARDCLSRSSTYHNRNPGDGLSLKMRPKSRWRLLDTNAAQVMTITCALVSIQGFAATQSREIGASAPTDTTAELLGLTIPEDWNRGNVCFSHHECGPNKFCMWTWCNSWEGWFYVCGTCALFVHHCLLKCHRSGIFWSPRVA